MQRCAMADECLKMLVQRPPSALGYDTLHTFKLGIHLMVVLGVLASPQLCGPPSALRYDTLPDLPTSWASSYLQCAGQPVLLHALGQVTARARGGRASCNVPHACEH